jgi:carboxyvinyl-carboxyphosphonate phosphorylmutase
MLSAVDKRRVLQDVLADDACLAPASVSDPLAMRAAQEIGFEVAMLAGSIASLVILGAPDIALITATELIEQVRRICRAGDLPLLVDGDHGYGNALNVRRTVEDMEAAGAAAMTVEDTELPAPFGTAGTRLLTHREIAGKIRAALDARTDPGFMIVGRTSATLTSDRDDLLQRQLLLQDAGADAVFVVGVKALEEVDALATGARVPLILGSLPAGATREQLAERGVRLCLAGHQAYFDGVAAVYRRMQQQRSITQPEAVDPKSLVKRLSLPERHAAWEKKFLN